MGLWFWEVLPYRVTLLIKPKYIPRIQEVCVYIYICMYMSTVYIYTYSHGQSASCCVEDNSFQAHVAPFRKQRPSTLKKPSGMAWRMAPKKILGRVLFCFNVELWFWIAASGS